MRGRVSRSSPSAGSPLALGHSGCLTLRPPVRSWYDGGRAICRDHAVLREVAEIQRNQASVQLTQAHYLDALTGQVTELTESVRNLIDYLPVVDQGETE